VFERCQLKLDFCSQNDVARYSWTYRAARRRAD
jgi:hypothetical protein